MRNLIKYFILLLIITIDSKSNAQVSVLGNSGTGSNYVGWNAAQAFELNVQHLGQQNINLKTNGTHRLVIRGSGNGFVGIGNGFNVPTSLLHINGNNDATDELFRTDCNINNSPQWRFNRGGTQRARFFNNNNDEHFHLESTRGDIIFDANSTI
ncbi:MAG TPA: hypothetical protein PKN75_02750 [Bacteroidia bacterium]|nr:hypothetical protein [Bacteroidia bacterium]HNU32485.1 hypothetical protein [Bacteroidia bacterium]